MEKQSLKLSELNAKVKEVLLSEFSDSYWIIAEISELKVNTNGHCYLELIETSKENGIVAKARATIWSYTFRMLKPYFETTTRKSFTAGLTVLMKATVQFHEVYGYSLNITDIDPAYTLGEMAKRKAETIKRLEQEGVLYMNKTLNIPIVPQRVAIISSKTAAGYGDFIHQLDTNPFGYKITYELFSSVMQGDEAESSIINSLENIYKHEDSFDVVAIIRGGGSQADLDCFNSYWLAYHITQFPLPVLSGIGHEQDDSVLDKVAHTRLKTPTAVAEFILNKFAVYEEELLQEYENASYLMKIMLNDNQTKLDQYVIRFTGSVKDMIQMQKLKLANSQSSMVHKGKQFIIGLGNKLTNQTHWVFRMTKFALSKTNQILNNTENQLTEKRKKFLREHKHKLNLFQNTIDHLNPDNLLKRGYSFTMFNGKVLKNTDQIDIGDTITSKLSKGLLISKITKKAK